ncbi:MAG: response regulator [Planctomycetia bacterium]|nr:response regulator [Planctomycetia bacterium]
MYSFLIVSDDDSIRGLFRKSLNGDYIIHYPKTHDEALQLFLHKDIDIIFVDILLNNNGACILLESLKQIKFDSSIVVLVPESQPSLTEEVLKIGTYELIEKPLTKESIHRTLKRALEKQELKKELCFIQSQIKNLQPKGNDSNFSELIFNKQTNTGDTHLTYKEVFQKFSKVLTHVYDFGNFAEMTVEAMAEIFGVGRVVFMLIYKEGISRPFRYFGLDEVAAKSICFNLDHGTMLWLAKIIRY